MLFGHTPPTPPPPPTTLLVYLILFDKLRNFDV